ncbi:hypothetical protein INT43_005106 [Umbelopsis isabellina]|uniref:Tip elongation aberrant protein 1 n=1 Tax=Mortierella isabellina TaxID=91625 RepID=A0A8H7PI55_MORIS|nr:hypothetical protein INT43_005106 [Umbelopsis isabellina]
MFSVYGGEPKTVEDPIDDALYILNLANKQWTHVRMEGRLPRGRTGHSAILHGMNMYIWGGESDGVYFQELLHFDLTALNTAPRWRALQSQNEGPCARAHHVSAVCNNKLYIFSGTDGRNVHNDIWSFDLNTGYWEQIAALGYIPAAREGASSAVVDDVLYIFGGRAGDGQLLGDLRVFNNFTSKQDKRWYMFQNMGPSPSPRAGHTMTAVKDKVLVLGGEPANGIKSEDASMIYILDTNKIKYPGDAAAGGPSSPTTARAPELALTNGSSPSPTRGLQTDTPSPTTGYHPSSLAHQRQSTMPPRAESPVIHSPIEARPPGGGRGNQLSVHPNNQTPPQNQQARPQRHASMIPEAVLRRNRPTSPMPFVDSEPKRENSLNHSNGEQHHGEVSGGRAEHEKRLERSDSDTLNNDDLYEGMSMNSTLDGGMSFNHNSPAPAPLPTSPGIQRPPSRAANGTGNQPPPPRPSREGVDIGNNYRNTIAIPQGELQLGQNTTLGPISPKDRRPKSQVPAPDQIRDLRSVSPIPSPRAPAPLAPEHMRSESPLALRNPSEASIKPSTAKSQTSKDEQAQAYSEERANFARELKARDAIISEMKKKEQWWRTEVSLARKSRAKEEDVTVDSDETFMTFDSPDSEKTKMFEQLVRMKAELRKVRSSIGQQSNGSCQRVVQAERMRTAALQEAAYFKSKYTAIQSKQSEELAQIETARAKELEDRLVHALSENDVVQKKLLQIQKKLNHEQQARQLAEDRAVEANAMANDTQEAHSRAVEELSNLHTRTLQAEAQVRNSAARIADLTSQLDKALTTEVSSTALSDATIKISQLEASSIKLRSELATMKQKLAESEDENERLRNSLMEKESNLIETTRILEDNEIKIGMMKDAMVKKGFEIDIDPSQSVRSEAAARLLELQQELTELKKVSKKSIQELKDEVAIYEARYTQLRSSERQAAEKARIAADDVARLQRDLRAMESSKTANDNAELVRTKAILAELESALSEARKSESEARLSLQEASQTYQSKIQHLEREHQIATEMAKASEETLEQVKKEATSTETKLQQLTSTLEDLQETNQKLTVQVKAVQDSQGNRRQSESQSKFIQAQIQWEAEKGMLDSKINELHHNLEALQLSSKGSSNKATEITQQLESVQLERDHLISECVKLKNKHSDHKKESRRQARELNLEIQQLTKQIDQTTSELEAMTMTNTHLKKELDIALQNQRNDESEKWTEEKNNLVKQLDEQSQSMRALKSERDLLKKQYQDSQRKIELLLDQMNESDDEVVDKPHGKSAAKDDDTEYSAIDESSDEEIRKSTSLKYIPELSNGNREPNMMQSIKSELNNLNKWTNGAYDSDDSDSDEEVVRSVQSPATLRKLEHSPATPSRSPARSQARSPGRSPMRTPVQNHDTLDSSDEEGYDSMIHSLEAVSMKAQSITGNN